MKLAMLLSILLMLVMISCGEDPVQVQENSKKIVRSGDVSKTELCQMESFEIYGENFDKYAEPIQVLFNNAPVQILNVSKDALLISIPETQDSVGKLIVVKGSDSVKIDHEIRVKPEICVDVTSLLKYEVAPGEVILGKGNGLGKYKGVMEAIIESQEASLEVISDTECTVDIPDLNYGTHVIKFLVGTEVVGEFKILVKGEAGNLDFDITTLEPQRVYRGDIFTVRGKGFGSDLEQCKVYVESYTKGAFKTAEIVSLTDSKIEAIVPFEALLGECKVKVIVGGTAKIASQSLEIVTDDYKTVSISLKGFIAEVYTEHIYYGDKYVQTDLKEMPIADIVEPINEDWVEDSLTCSWNYKEVNDIGRVDSWSYKFTIQLDTANKIVKSLFFRIDHAYEDVAHHSDGTGSDWTEIKLKNIPYTTTEDSLILNLDKSSSLLDAFGYEMQSSDKGRISSSSYNVFSNSHTTGKYVFLNEFEFIFKLTK